MDRVTLTPSEAAWFSRNLDKMLIQMEKESRRKDAKILERKTYKVMDSMRPEIERTYKIIEAFGEDEQYVIDVMLNDKQRLLVKQLVGSVHKGLVERVIPEYKKRGESHAEYQSNAEAKAVFLEKLWRKVK